MKRYFLHTIATLLITACQQTQVVLLPEEEMQLAQLEERLDAIEAAAPDEVTEYEKNTYEHFLSHHGYPHCMVIFHDNKLMQTATPENSHVVISLYQQRGRLYVDDKVVADWPVSTGVEGRATTPGQYKVLEKKKDHASRRFGSIKNAAGDTLVADADSRKHKLPAGAVWEGAAMPNWMRLTDYGMGMHTGAVQAGTCLSHGCIRMPDFIAAKIFDIVEVGYPVTVTEELEDEFPAQEALLAGSPYNNWVYEKNELENEIKQLYKTAEARLTPPAETAADETQDTHPSESSAESAAGITSDNESPAN